MAKMFAKKYKYEISPNQVFNWISKIIHPF
jgi:hypothetical protein